LEQLQVGARGRDSWCRGTLVLEQIKVGARSRDLGSSGACEDGLPRHLLRRGASLRRLKVDRNREQLSKH
jgi:hypothetical protein